MWLDPEEKRQIIRAQQAGHMRRDSSVDVGLRSVNASSESASPPDRGGWALPFASRIEPTVRIGDRRGHL